MISQWKALLILTLWIGILPSIISSFNTFHGIVLVSQMTAFFSFSFCWLSAHVAVETNNPQQSGKVTRKHMETFKTYEHGRKVS